MDNLEKNELTQLVIFYKQKLSDTELDLLKLRLEINKLNSFISSLTKEPALVKEPAKKSK